MGHELELNYIVKATIPENTKGLKPGDHFQIAKKGIRHFMMRCPLYLADCDWNIIGKCVVNQQSTENGFTALTCTLLFMFTEEESKIVTRLNRIGENELSKIPERMNLECPVARSLSDVINTYEGIPDEDDELLTYSDALYLRDKGVTIAYLHNNEIHLQGEYVGSVGKGKDIHSNHNNIWIDESGNLKTDIRHSKFKNKSGFEGIAFSKFDLID